MPTVLPSKDEEVIQLLRQIAIGVTGNPALWVNPPVTVAQINAAANELETAVQDQATKKALAEQATQAKKDKNANGRSVNSRLKRWAESLVGQDDPRLNQLGFTGPATPTPLVAPGQPVTLESCNEKTSGQFELRWKKPSEGGTVATYKIYRKVAPATAFTLLDAIAGNETRKILIAQPVNTAMQYYVTAQNNAGEGPESNTVDVKL